MTKISKNQGIENFSSSIKKFSDSKSSEIKESLFNKIDTNKDGKITQKELIEAGYQGKDAELMRDAIFFTERTVNKWFTADKNKNGSWDNIEVDMWDLHNNNPNGEIEDLSPEKFAQKHNIKTDGNNYSDMQEWIQGWITDSDPMIGIKVRKEEQLGRKLTKDETQMLYDAMKNQMNRWLFKKDALYNNLTSDSYTRLITSDETISCCGGSIDKPPVGPQNPEEGCAFIFCGMNEENSKNSANEIKNRLAWGMFRTLPQEQVQHMSPAAYKHYQNQWQQVRDMKASDFRELAKPENTANRQKFEEASLMSVRQIVEYIDIVESVTGKDFDSDDWSIDIHQFHEILEKINGTYNEENDLAGKTRKDIPADRQNLLRYLEEHNLLLDQFKE